MRLQLFVVGVGSRMVVVMDMDFSTSIQFHAQRRGTGGCQDPGRTDHGRHGGLVSQSLDLVVGAAEHFPELQDADLEVGIVLKYVGYEIGDDAVSDNVPRWIFPWPVFQEFDFDGLAPLNSVQNLGR
jgi:hypothetical protein